MIPLQQSSLQYYEASSAVQLYLTCYGLIRTPVHIISSFLQIWGMSHNISSPRYPQSNGKAEATVKSMKKLISAAWTGRGINWNQQSRALLQYRNTPCRKDGLSPAQNIFGHPVQDQSPALQHPQNGKSHIKKKLCKHNNQHACQKAAGFADW